jgi:hypothetical protein
VAKVVLDSSGVLAVIGKLVPAAVPQHVAVDEKTKALQPHPLWRHALIAANAQRGIPLGDEESNLKRLLQRRQSTERGGLE